MKQNILLFICQFIIWSNASAQFYSLDLPFVKDSSEPELFMFEPHYDSQNKVTHYTFGDFLKVEYVRNENGSPLKKICYKWERYDLAWEKNYETTYKYNVDGKLIEERTEMLYPKIDRNNIMNIKTTIALKQINYDIASHTDTIREILHIPKVGNYGGNSDSTFTVRYLNKYNLPDSVIMEKSYGYFTYRQKLIYSYDNKGRNLFTEAFHQEDNMPWRKSYTINTMYEKNKITHIQTPEPLTEEKIEILKEEIGESWEEFYDTRPAIFSIELDNKGRVSSKKLTLGAKSILDATYTYNQQGKTLVKHEQTMDRRLFSQVGGLVGPIPLELTYLQYSIRYPNAMCSESTYYNRNEDGELQKIMEMGNCYSPEGRLISSDMTRYDLDDGAFNDRKIIQTTYNADGLSGEILEYGTTDEEDVKDLLTTPDEKTIFKNDESGLHIFKEKHSYYSYDNTWTPKSRTYYKYDENGYETFMERWEYDRYDKNWEAKYCYSYVHDSLNRVLLKEEKIWNNNAWEPYIRECFAYNTFDDKSLLEEYRWIDSENYWQGISKDSITYDSAGEVLEELGYRWSDEQKAWQPNRKYCYENTTDYSKETRFSWNENKWKPVASTFRGKRSPDAKTWESSYAIWNDAKNDWLTKTLEKRAQPTDSTSLTEYYAWNDNLEILEGEDHIFSENLSNNTAVRKTYSLWNYDTNTWMKAVRHTVRKNGSEQEFIFENFDRKANNWLFEKKVSEQAINDTVTHIIYYSWDKTVNDWKKSRKQIYHYSMNNWSHPVKEEYYEFDKNKNDWKSAYYGEKIIHEGNDGFQYFQWDEKTQSRTPYFMKTGSNWYPSLYSWNPANQTWVKFADSDKRDKIIKQLKSYFVIEQDVDYSEMVYENKEKSNPDL